MFHKPGVRNGPLLHCPLHTVCWTLSVRDGGGLILGLPDRENCCGGGTYFSRLPDLPVQRSSG